MNYFEWFGLPASVEIDEHALKTKFLQLQQQFHPDRNSDDVDAVTKSSDINQAYQTLAQVDSRAAYLLQLQKQDQGLDQSIADFEFLQSALELRELLDDATKPEHLQQIRHDVEQWITGLSREFALDYAEQDWAEARDTVRKLKFFKHVLQDIDKAEDRLHGDDDFAECDDF